MKGFKKELIFIFLGILSPLSLHALKVNAGSFGAEIFCTMRDGGNDHESSWDAAYSYIKKQKGGLFKVSPKNAAAQITETVIREREKFLVRNIIYKNVFFICEEPCFIFFFCFAFFFFKVER